MQKVIINIGAGPFALSDTALNRVEFLKGHPVKVEELYRDDPDLVQAVKELCSAAYGKGNLFAIVNIPDSQNWEIVKSDNGREVINYIKWS